MKKIIKIFSVVLLTLFSFYYTDYMASLVKKKDPIMIKIEEEKQNYIEEPVNAIIDDDYIIPGMNGISVDVDKSYNKMKKLGEYNDNLYMFIDVYPKVSIKNQFDKFIINGNTTNKEISLIFNIENEDKLDYINDILSVLKSKDITANFFIDGKYLENKTNLLEQIAINGNFLGNLGYDNKYDRLTIKYTNSLIDKFVNYDNNFCYVEEDNYDVLDLCSSLNMYTIKSSLISSTNSYRDIKENLKNGGIYTLDINKYTTNDLGVIINYIKYKGYEIVTLNELISEEKN